MLTHETILATLCRIAAGEVTEGQAIKLLADTATRVRDTSEHATLYQQAIADLRLLHAEAHEAQILPWRRGFRLIGLLPGQFSEEDIEVAFPALQQESARAQRERAEGKSNEQASGTIGSLSARCEGESYTVTLDSAAWTNLLSLLGYAWASAALAQDAVMGQGAQEMRAALRRADLEENEQ